MQWWIKTQKKASVWAILHGVRSKTSTSYYTELVDCIFLVGPYILMGIPIFRWVRMWKTWLMDFVVPALWCDNIADNWRITDNCIRTGILHFHSCSPRWQARSDESLHTPQSSGKRGYRERTHFHLCCGSARRRGPPSWIAGKSRVLETKVQGHLQSTNEHHNGEIFFQHEEPKTRRDHGFISKCT